MIQYHTTSELRLQTVDHLCCLHCDRRISPSHSLKLCPVCGTGRAEQAPSVLDFRYRYQNLRDLHWIDGGRHDLFRYGALLPTGATSKIPNTGMTPLREARVLGHSIGLEQLWFKDERGNPTGSLQDRGTALAVAAASENGVSAMYCASRGITALSLAHYSAAAKLDCRAYLPSTIAPTIVDRLKNGGVQVRISTGDYEQAFRESEALYDHPGWSSRNRAYNPYLVEGKKTAAWEIGEQCDFALPELVVCPVVEGGSLSALAKGFREMLMLGFVERVPRLLGVNVQRSPTPRNGLRLDRELSLCGGELLDPTPGMKPDTEREFLATVSAPLDSASLLAWSALKQWLSDRPRAIRSAVVMLSRGC